MHCCSASQSAARWRVLPVLDCLWPSRVTSPPIGAVAVSGEKLFERAGPFQDDVLALPVADIDEAASYYSMSFGMSEVSRAESPRPRIVLERDGVQLGFEVNGGDSTQDGAAILVTDASRARAELEAKGVATANWRIDERDGETFQVFFVVAPDGLCYYFHQLIPRPS